MSALEIAALTENFGQALALVNAELEKMECSLKVKTLIDVAVEEIFVNIAHYAYVPDTGDVNIEVTSRKKPREITIVFRDHGVPYNPLEKPDPDTSLPAEKRPIGGLGIYMAKKCMDAMEYEYQDGTNILTLKKILDK